MPYSNLQLGGLLRHQGDISWHVDFQNGLSHLAPAFDTDAYELVMAWAAKDDFFALMHGKNRRPLWYYVPRGGEESSRGGKWLLSENATSLESLRQVMEGARTGTNIYSDRPLLKDHEFLDMLEDTLDLLQGRPQKQRFRFPRPERLYGRVIQL